MTDRRPTSRLAAALLALVLVAGACGDDSGGGDGRRCHRCSGPERLHHHDRGRRWTRPKGHRARARRCGPISRACSRSTSTSSGSRSSRPSLPVRISARSTRWPWIRPRRPTLSRRQPIRSRRRPTSSRQWRPSTRTPRTWPRPSARCTAWPAGEQFLELWQAHVDALFDYASARAEGDDAGAAAARVGAREQRRGARRPLGIGQRGGDHRGASSSPSSPTSTPSPRPSTGSSPRIPPPGPPCERRHRSLPTSPWSWPRPSPRSSGSTVTWKGPAPSSEPT